MKYTKYILLGILLILFPFGVLEKSSDNQNQIPETKIKNAVETSLINKTNIANFSYITGTGTEQDPYVIQNQENIKLDIDESFKWILVRNCTLFKSYIYDSSNIIVTESDFLDSIDIENCTKINVTKNHIQGKMKDYAIILSSSKNIQIVENRIEFYHDGIWIAGGSKLDVRGNQVSNCVIGIKVGMIQDSQIVENDIGDSYPSLTYFGVFYRKNVPDRPDRIGILAYLPNETSLEQIQNNTIHNIFGIGLSYQGNFHEKLLETNVFENNLQNSPEDTIKFVLNTVFYDFYLVVAFFIGFGLFTMIYNKTHDKSEEKIFLLVVQAVILILLLREADKRAIFGFGIMLEEIGLYFSIKNLSLSKITSSIKINTKRLWIFTLVGSILAVGIGILFATEQIFIIENYNIIRKSGFQWDGIFMICSIIFWILSTFMITKIHREKSKKRDNILDTNRKN